MPYEASAKYGGRHWAHFEILDGANLKNNWLPRQNFFLKTSEPVAY